MKQFFLKKRAQEEMIGFVLIVLLVMIIFVVFLFISGSKNEESYESSEISSFLESLKIYTASCGDSSETDFYSITELIAECRDNQKCYSGENSCEVLDSEIGGILNQSWEMGINNLKGYSLEIIYGESEGGLNFEEGNTTSFSRIGTTSFIRGGKITISLTNFY